MPALVPKKMRIVATIKQQDPDEIAEKIEEAINYYFVGDTHPTINWDFDCEMKNLKVEKNRNKVIVEADAMFVLGNVEIDNAIVRTVGFVIEAVRGFTDGARFDIKVDFTDVVSEATRLTPSNKGK